MRPPSLALLAALVALPAPAEAAALCAALDRLAQRVAATGQTERIGIVKFEAEPLMIGCTPPPTGPEAGAFCDAALQTLGIEFYHPYPWRLRECLRASGVRPAIRTTGGASHMRRRRIVQMTGALAGGVRLDLRFTPDRETGAFPGYYGRYDLALWKP